MKKILVVYYSLTGNTKKVAEEISKNLNVDSDRVVVKGKHMPFQKKFEMSYQKDPSNYDLIIVGTPVWAFGPVPAVKKYLVENKKKIKKIAFFCTHAGIIGKTLPKMEESSKEPIAKLDIKFSRFRNIVEDSYEDKIKKFCEGLK